MYIHAHTHTTLTDGSFTRDTFRARWSNNEQQPITSGSHFDQQQWPIDLLVTNRYPISTRMSELGPKVNLVKFEI